MIRKSESKAIFLLWLLWAIDGLCRQVGTLAGDGTANFLDGPATSAQFNYPTGLQVDWNGKKAFIGDFYNCRIRTYQASGNVVSTLAGDGTQDDKDGAGTTASFYSPTGLHFLKANDSLFVADSQNHLLRRILLSSRIVSTLVGTGTAGSSDGQGISAQLNDPVSLTYFNGFIFIAECTGNLVRKVDYLNNMAVTTLAGTFGANSFADGQGAAARFSCPKAIDFDSSGNLFIADSLNHRIRMVTQGGLVSTVAGTGNQGSFDGSTLSSTFNQPSGLAVDRSTGDIYISDTYNHKIRLLNNTSNQVSTIAGTGVDAHLDGDALSAKFKYPHHLAFYNETQTLLVADRDNERIRIIVSCRNGTHYDPSIDSWQCITCPENSVTCDETGFTCGPGRFKNGNTCQECSSNAFKAISGNQDCDICPVGTESSVNRTVCEQCAFNSTRPFTTMTNCMECPLNVVACNSTHVDCATKYYFDNTTLACQKIYAPCDVNKFRAFRLFDCYSCPQYSNCTGTDEYFYCNPGYALNGTEDSCSHCRNGTYKASAGNQDCTPCPTGFESAPNKTMCLPCPDDTFRSSITFSHCYNCPDGGQCTKSSMVCVPGWSLNTTLMNTCVPCTDGFYKSTYSTQACDVCPGGYFSNDDYTDCLECQQGEVRDTADLMCISCAIGTESNYERTACLPCNDNYYRPTLNDRRCIACPNGAICTATSFTCRTNWALNADKKGCTRTTTTAAAAPFTLSDEAFISIVSVSAVALLVAGYLWFFKPAPPQLDPSRVRKGYRVRPQDPETMP